MVSTFYYCAILSIFIAASSSSALEAKDALAPAEEPEKLDEAEMPDDFVHPLPLRRRGVAEDRDLWGWWGAEEDGDDWNSGWGGSSSSSGKSGKSSHGWGYSSSGKSGKSSGWSGGSSGSSKGSKHSSSGWSSGSSKGSKGSSGGSGWSSGSSGGSGWSSGSGDGWW